MFGHDLLTVPRIANHLTVAAQLAGATNVDAERMTTEAEKLHSEVNADLRMVGLVAAGTAALLTWFVMRR